MDTVASLYLILVTTYSLTMLLQSPRNSLHCSEAEETTACRAAAQVYISHHTLELVSICKKKGFYIKIRLEWGAGKRLLLLRSHSVPFLEHRGQPHAVSFRLPVSRNCTYESPMGLSNLYIHSGCLFSPGFEVLLQLIFLLILNFISCNLKWIWA